MHSDRTNAPVAVFDLGGTWFRWGLYRPSSGLADCQRTAAINYLSRPELSARELQTAMVDFVVRRVTEFLDRTPSELGTISISLGAPVNAHDMTVLGSGPLWGSTAQPFQLRAWLQDALPKLNWHVVNDVTALLSAYMDDCGSYRKTMLVTVSSGIGSRLYDHRTRRIPYDGVHGIQGEIGHLVCAFELDGKLIHRPCECGGWDHMNAFASGRGIAWILNSLPSLSNNYGAMICDSLDSWRQADDQYRLAAFKTELERGNASAVDLLDRFVSPLSRTVATALSLDPEIDRIVVTGGVTHGLGEHYREALQRTFLSDGLYQITPRDPQYLDRRLQWENADDFAGLRGAGLYVLMTEGC